jgi:membrane-associated phospholipid phosphatase
MMKPILSLWLVVLVATSLPATAQVDSLHEAPAIGDTILHDLAAFGTDALLLVRSPDARTWAIAGGTFATIGIATTIDDDVRAIALRNQGSDGDRIAEAGNFYGTWIPALGVSGGLYITGLAFDWPRVRVAGRHVAQAVAYAGLVTTVAKFAIGRERPLFDEGQYVFAPFTFDDRYFSLPSGHSTLAFAVSSSLAADIDEPAATVALYGLATITALSRIYSDRHWTSDVLLGAAVGVACGYGVGNLDGGDGRTSMTIMPYPNGLAVLVTF